MPEMLLDLLRAARGAGVRISVAESLDAARGGIRSITSFDLTDLPMTVAGLIENFDPLVFVKPRKTLKVLARDSQLALAAASL